MTRFLADLIVDVLVQVIATLLVEILDKISPGPWLR